MQFSRVESTCFKVSMPSSNATKMVSCSSQSPINCKRFSCRPQSTANERSRSNCRRSEASRSLSANSNCLSATPKQTTNRNCFLLSHQPMKTTSVIGAARTEWLPGTTCTMAASLAPLLLTVPLMTEPNLPLPITSWERSMKFLGICQMWSRTLRSKAGVPALPLPSEPSLSNANV